MDFTFLFIAVLMVIAMQSGLWWLAVGLLVLLFLSAKSKLMIVAAIAGGATAGVGFLLGPSTPPWTYLIGLFVVLVLLVKGDSAGPEAGAYGGYAR